MSKVSIFAGVNFIATIGVVGYVVFSGTSDGDTPISANEPAEDIVEVREVRGVDGTSKWVRSPEAVSVDIDLKIPKIPSSVTTGIATKKNADSIPASKEKSGAGRNLVEADIYREPEVMLGSDGSVTSPTEEVSKVVAANPEYMVVRKPSYVKLYVGGMGDTINGFVEDGSYAVEIAADDSVPDVSFQSYPYEGNSFRLTDYPGFCGRVAVAEYGQDTFMWVPDHIDPADGILGQVSPVVSDPIKAKIAPIDIPDLKVGVWVVCGKRDDRIPPFYDMRILEQIDGIDLGNPTYIF